MYQVHLTVVMGGWGPAKFAQALGPRDELDEAKCAHLRSFEVEGLS